MHIGVYKVTERLLSNFRACKPKRRKIQNFLSRHNCLCSFPQQTHASNVINFLFHKAVARVSSLATNVMFFGSWNNKRNNSLSFARKVIAREKLSICITNAEILLQKIFMNHTFFPKTFPVCAFCLFFRIILFAQEIGRQAASLRAPDPRNFYMQYFTQYCISPFTQPENYVQFLFAGHSSCHSLQFSK